MYFICLESYHMSSALSMKTSQTLKVANNFFI